MKKSEKPKLLLLSDMWGKQKMSWLPQYIEQLEHEFEVVFKDSRELGRMDLNITEEKDLHKRFIEGGINQSVQTLTEDQTTYAALLGMSVGGTIGWKAILGGLKVERYYGVSATRLRYETQKPDIPIRLYFGTEDPYSPGLNWQKKMSLEAFNLTLRHDMYYEKVVTRFICNHIVFDPIPKTKEVIKLKRK